MDIVKSTIIKSVFEGHWQRKGESLSYRSKEMAEYMSDALLQGNAVGDELFITFRDPELLALIVMAVQAAGIETEVIARINKSGEVEDLEKAWAGR